MMAFDKFADALLEGQRRIAAAVRDEQTAKEIAEEEADCRVCKFSRLEEDEFPFPRRA